MMILTCGIGGGGGDFLFLLGSDACYICLLYRMMRKIASTHCETL